MSKCRCLVSLVLTMECRLAKKKTPFENWSDTKFLPKDISASDQIQIVFHLLFKHTAHYILWSKARTKFSKKERKKNINRKNERTNKNWLFQQEYSTRCSHGIHLHHSRIVLSQESWWHFGLDKDLIWSSSVSLPINIGRSKNSLKRIRPIWMTQFWNRFTFELAIHWRIT